MRGKIYLGLACVFAAGAVALAVLWVRSYDWRQSYYYGLEAFGGHTYAGVVFFDGETLLAAETRPGPLGLGEAGWHMEGRQASPGDSFPGILMNGTARVRGGYAMGFGGFWIGRDGTLVLAAPSWFVLAVVAGLGMVCVRRGRRCRGTGRGFPVVTGEAGGGRGEGGTAD